MIIVTGASGFIGSNLVNHLRTIGKHVIAVDFVRRDYIDSRIDFIYAYDLMDVIEHYDIECVFHEGAISSTTETDWTKLWNKNVEYSFKLMLSWTS